MSATGTHNYMMKHRLSRRFRDHHQPTFVPRRTFLQARLKDLSETERTKYWLGRLRLQLSQFIAFGIIIGVQHWAGPRRQRPAWLPRRFPMRPAFRRKSAA
jgi:hypothetical protein